MQETLTTEICLPQNDLPLLETNCNIFEIHIKEVKENIATDGTVHPNVNVVLEMQHGSALYELGRSMVFCKEETLSSEFPEGIKYPKGFMAKVEAALKELDDERTVFGIDFMPAPFWREEIVVDGITVYYRHFSPSYKGDKSSYGYFLP